MTEELYIEGQLVDMLPNKVTRNLQIGKLGDVADRESNYSNTVKLPMTEKNISIFEYLGISGNTSRKQYKKLQCRYIVDGIPLIQSGYCVVQSVTEAYEVVLYDGIIDLGEALGDKLISDLSFADINHFVSPTNFNNNRTNQSGYIYPIGNYGAPVVNNIIRTDVMSPALYLTDVWDRIFNQNGFSYTGDFFENNEYFQTEVMTMGKGFDVSEENIEYEEFGTATTLYTRHQEDSTSPIDVKKKLGYANIDMTGISYSSTTKAITFNQGGFHQIYTDIDYRVMRDNPHVVVKVYYELNGEFVASTSLSPAKTDKDFTINLNVNPGDELVLWVNGYDKVYNDTSDSGRDTSYDLYDYYGSYVQNAVYGGYYHTEGERPYRVRFSLTANIKIDKISNGTPIKFEELVADIGQLEFIKDVVKRYGLLIRPLRDSNTYEFIEFEKILGDRANAEDWTDRYISTKEEKYDSTYGRTNKATYKYEKDVEIPTHDGEIIIDVETLKEESTIFSSIFTIAQKSDKVNLTLPEGIFTELDVPLYNIPLWNIDEEGVIESADAAARIFRIGWYDAVNTETQYGNSNVIELDGMIPYLSLDSIGMNFYLGNHYKAFAKVIDNYKEISMGFRLSEIDIYNLDFYKLKYLKQYGKYFYLNKVRYSGGDNAEAVLIEINEFVKNEPPTQLYDINITMGSKAAYVLTYDMFFEQGYLDPEGNEPKYIRFVSGFTNSRNARIMAAGHGMITNQEQVIDVSNRELDMYINSDNYSSTPEASTNVYEYQVMDSGSGEWSEVRGTLTINVLDYVNVEPNVYTFYSSYGIATNNPEYSNLEGDKVIKVVLHARFKDETGFITSAQWELVEKPATATTFDLVLPDSGTGDFVYIPYDSDNAGIWTFRLTVCDDLGSCTTRETSIDIVIQDQREDNDPDSPYRG